ncbi:AraC family transcriptional regulator [Sphingosinicella sp. CPCC 101087]|uniref:AraC family transcriptional regulator n=1 Tax=Sphingosinicella sp. CPCC 101087 TaxID=2497754 RepID=UPI00101B9844|nr:AraC family transcriptional regulator [Sphingosinicella sp. CPCC 101087]
MDQLRDIAGIIARHAPGEGVSSTPIARVDLIRSSRPTKPMPTVYQPSLCLIAQGRKQGVLGDRTFIYEPAHYLIVGLDLPVVGHVIEASEDKPYLCVRLGFDPLALGQLVLDTPAPDARGDSSPSALGMSLCAAGPELLDAALRLLRLLDDPAGAPVLAPLAERELLYRLLTGPQGATMRQIATGRSYAARIARAVAWIKRHFDAPFSVERLAGEVGMSPSSLHAHFKAVTAMSPLQYQKQLRLQEARRLMLAESLDAATAGFRVGYDSPSQFSREYRRLFGAPPRSDVSRLREAPELLTVTA